MVCQSLSRILSPGACFCPGSALGRHLMGFERIGRPIYDERGLEPRPGWRPDLIHRPGVGTSLWDGWCLARPKAVLSCSLLLVLFLCSTARPFLRPDRGLAQRRAQAPSRMAARPPPEAARSVLDGAEHGARLVGLRRLCHRP